MTAHPTATRYTPTAIALHWLLAVLILGNMGLGLYMTGLPFSPARLQYYNWHKWAGVVVLALSAARLLWRLTHRPPATPPMPAWQARLARAVHLGLYGLFFALPLSGWAYSSAAGFPVVVFGVWPLPDFVPVDRALSELIKPVHEWLGIGMGLLLLAHVGGAFKHQLIDRDGLLQRMLPARS